MNIELDKAVNSIVSGRVLRELKKASDIIVFGAGDSGDWAVNLLRKNNIFPKCYCDNSQGKQGEYRNGLLIKSFEDAVKEYEAAAICIASMWREEIYNQIQAYDCELIERTYDLLTSMAWETAKKQYNSEEYEYIKDYEVEFEKLYQEFEDDKSKQTLEGLLNYRLTRENMCLQRVKSNEMTYLDRTVINKNCFERIYNGAIIDGGAFDGDTVEMFVKTLGKHKKLEIHCYEAEPQNYNVIENKIAMKEWKPHEVILHKAALWDKRGEVGFDGTGLSGYTNEVGSQKIKAETIDDYGYRDVGLIKLDIEGAERNALLGARNTIKRCRPVLAICAYHLQDDILVLSDFIKALECNYKLVLRHYMLSAGDTILYGIPK